MPRTAALLLAGLTAALVLLYWLLGPSSEPRPATPRPDPETALAAPNGSTRRADPALAEDPAAEAPRTEIEAPEAAPDEDTDPWARDEQDTMAVRVLDELGRPVAGASIRPWAMRAGPPSPAHVIWRGEEKTVTTDGEGRAQFDYWTWALPRARSIEITVSVKHPEFPELASHDLEVASGEQEIRLARGTLLSVSGWITDAGERLFDVEPRAETSDGWLDPEAWDRRAGRPPSTHQAPAGPLTLWLEAEREGRRYSSTASLIALEAATPHHEHLRLEPMPELRGRLADSVPRPVKNGTAQACVVFHRGGRFVSAGRKTVEIDADGTFAFGQLAPGLVEVVATVDGFRSPWKRQERDPTDYAEDLPEAVLRSRYAIADLRNGTAEIEVAMLPSASCRVRLVDPSGNPLRGAQVMFWPNAYFTAYSTDFIDFARYQATTDAAGEVLVEGLPGDRQSYGIRLDGWQPPLQNTQGRETRQQTVELTSGSLTETTVTMQPR